MDPVAEARQSAYNAKRAWAVSKGRPHTNANLALLTKARMPNANYRNMRSKIESAARSSYAQIKAELEAEVAKGTCPMVTGADIEFLSMALSQLLTEEELETLAETGAAGGWRANAANGSQGGGARYKQKGGALGTAIMNFFRSLCSRAGRYSANSNAATAGNIDAVAAAVAATSHADITQTLILGLAGAGTARGLLTGHNGLATVALSAFNIVNSILPNCDLVIANSASYMMSWVPVGVAAAPVVGKLAVIGACAIALWETNKFVLTQGAALFRGASGGGVAGYKAFLKGLCEHLLSVFSRYVTGSIQARTSRVANVRAVVAASAEQRRAIDAAVNAALPAAGGGLAGAIQVAAAQEPAPAAGGAGAGAGAGLLGFSPAPGAAAAGGGGGPLPTITEEQAEDAADAATEAGEVAERESHVAPRGAAAAAAAEGGGGAAAAAAEEEASQEAGFANLPVPTFNNGPRQALLRGAPGGGASVSGFTFRSEAGGAAASAPSGRGTKRTLTAAPAPGGGGKRGAASKRGKGGKSRKQHGGRRRSQKKTRKNRK